MFEDKLKTMPDKPSETSATAKRSEILTGKIIIDKNNGKNGEAPGQPHLKFFLLIGQKIFHDQFRSRISKLLELLS